MVPPPPPALPPGAESRVIPPPMPVTTPSQPATTTGLPAIAAPRTIELKPSETLPPVKPVVQPRDSHDHSRGSWSASSRNSLRREPRVINLVKDSTGLVPTRPPGPPAQTPVEEVAQGVSDLIAEIKAFPRPRSMWFSVRLS